LILMLT